VAVGFTRAEAAIGLGRVADPRRGRQTFRRYVEDTWLPDADETALDALAKIRKRAAGN
jgi:hypothetical protein